MKELTIIGNIGADAVINEYNGNKFFSFDVCVNETSRDKNGTTVKSSEWIRVSRNGDGGGLIQYLKKGTSVLVRGRVRIQKFQKKNGEFDAALHISADKIELLGSVQSGAQAGQQNASSVNIVKTAQGADASSARHQGSVPPPPTPPPGMFDGSDDEPPF